MQRRKPVNKVNQKSYSRLKLFNRYQLGSSLIEILITLIIMAVGLLGLASIQVISIKNVNNSQFRSLATAYAYDMAERMRSNRGGDYSDIDTTSITEPSCVSDDEADSCSVTQMVQLDAYQWAQEISQDVISGGLPTGTGTVTQDSSDDDVFNITVAWEEQGRDSDGGKIEDSSFTLTIEL